MLEWVAMPSSKDLPDPGIEPMSPALAGVFFTTGAPPGYAVQGSLGHRHDLTLVEVGGELFVICSQNPGQELYPCTYLV